ncbi:hypothetical protein DFH28DRAFT_1124752 [Melampsora americana]|nr:hypothetical protein DFH28DRAFT_1124752 [Melampsora americana]
MKKQKANPVSNTRSKRQKSSAQRSSKKPNPPRSVQQATKKSKSGAKPSSRSQASSSNFILRPNEKELSAKKRDARLRVLKEIANSRRTPTRKYPFTIRPISHLWVSQYLGSLGACRQARQRPDWYNVRVLGTPNPDALELVTKTLCAIRVIVTDIITLDLGWCRGEWMFNIPHLTSQNRLQSSGFHFTRGYFHGGYQSLPDIEFLIIRVPWPMELNSPRESVLVPVVLIGIPFYDSDLDLDQYLYESLTAQNKKLGIQQVIVKERYSIRGARCNDVRCHVLLDPSCIQEWDLENPMKVVLQGWDNDGVPRPEMWPVTIRHIDECSLCGSFRHLAEDGITELECNTRVHRRMLMDKRQVQQDKLAISASTPLQDRPMSNSHNHPSPAAFSHDQDEKTSIGSIITP